MAEVGAWGRCFSTSAARPNGSLGAITNFRLLRRPSRRSSPKSAAQAGVFPTRRPPLSETPAICAASCCPSSPLRTTRGTGVNPSVRRSLLPGKTRRTAVPIDIQLVFVGVFILNRMERSMVNVSSQKDKRVNSQVEVRDLLWAAFPPRPEDNRKGWLWHVARQLGWNQRRVKALFYCKARVVTADEWRTLNERLDAAKKRERERDELRAASRGVGTPLPMASRADGESAALPFETGPQAPAARRTA